MKRSSSAAGRVHEEYKEITTRPIQKITGAIRSNPLFSKPPVIQGNIVDQQELVPLTGGAARSEAVANVSSIRASGQAPTRIAVTSPDPSTRAGSNTGGSGQEQFSEFAAAPSLDRSVSGDTGSEQSATVGGSALAGLIGAKTHRSSGRGKSSVTKLQSHVD